MTKCPECGYPSEMTIAGSSTCGSCRDAWTRAFSKRSVDQDGNVHHWTDVHGIIQAMRGRGPSERRLSDITTALDRVRSSALEAAYRNESKPHWREESRETLALYLGEECGELMQALRRGTLDDVIREAGDLVWAVAMIVDKVAMVK